MKKYILLTCTLWTMHSFTATAKTYPDTPEQKRLDTELLETLFRDSTPEDIERLLKNGANPYAKNQRGQTTLMYASANEHALPAIIQMLFEKKVDLNIQDKWEKTALMYACLKPNPSPAIVQILLKLGANPNIKDQSLKTALMYACENPKISTSPEELSIIPALLIIAGADIKKLLSQQFLDPQLTDPYVEFAIKLRNFITTNQCEDLQVKQALENVWNQKENKENNPFSSHRNLTTIGGLNTSHKDKDSVLTIELALMLGINIQSFAIQYFEEIYKEYQRLKKHEKYQSSITKLKNFYQYII